MGVGILGVDLSHWNGNLNLCDFIKFKNLNVKFVMLKLGGEENGERSYKIDKKFFTFYHYAKEAGIKVGAYMFAGKECALWRPEENADYFIDYMEKNGIKLDYPFALDMEIQPKSRQKENTQYAKEWCTRVEERGYFAMIYGSDINTFDEILKSEELERFAFWVAMYCDSESKVKHKHAIWQFTNRLGTRINYLPILLGGNYASYDIAKVIEKKHLNHK